VPTAPSSSKAGFLAEQVRAVADLGPLLRFRVAGLRGRSRRVSTIAFGLIAVLTVLAGWLPGYLPDSDGRRSDVLLLLPSGYIGVLAVAIVSAAASGGGRELVAREQAVAFPVSPTTDHLGALLLAPLNIAWLMQSWALLGATSYVIGPHLRLAAALLPVLVWLAAATAIAQAIAWGVEWVRRGAHGALVIRLLAGVLLLTGAVLVVTHRVVPLLDHSPTVKVTLGVLYGASGQWLRWLGVLGVLVGITLLAVAVGAFVATAVAGRPARDELRVESSVHVARDNPGSDLVALLRTDRVGIWRSVPLRRGLLVLSFLPGLVAVAGALDWEMLAILPGLVASGGALLFGVNSWCLDGRGALWRDSLPVPPKLVFTSRVLVLVEVLLVATSITVLLASLRAGVPTASQLSAVLCAAVVVSLQVVAASLRWSVRRPFPVDMRSARATPAPPLVMVGYSSRLALTTTLTGLVFTITARMPQWQAAVLLALPFLLFSLFKLVRTSSEWADPETRSNVVAAVAG